MPMWLNSRQLRRNESIVGRAAGYKSAGKSHADVAQLAEQLICNQQVIGSSPIIGFIQFNIELYYGQIPEWPKGTDCKSAAFQLRWFESTRAHQGLQYPNRVLEFLFYLP